jgi:hypothetical protein
MAGGGGMAEVNLTLETTAAIFEKMYFNRQVRDSVRAGRELGTTTQLRDLGDDKTPLAERLQERLEICPNPYSMTYTEDAPCRLSVVITTCDDPPLDKYGKALVAEIKRRFMPQEAVQAPQVEATSRPAGLWDLVPDRGKDREMVYLLHQELTPATIATHINYSVTSIYKQTSILRKDMAALYGPEKAARIVPYCHAPKTVRNSKKNGKER